MSSVSLHKLCSASVQRAKGESPPTGVPLLPTAAVTGPCCHSRLHSKAGNTEVMVKGFPRIFFFSVNQLPWVVLAHGRERGIERKARDLLGEEGVTKILVCIPESKCY